MPYSAFDHAKPGPWQTELTPFETPRFENWLRANKIPYNPNPMIPQDYDMQGFWKDNPDYVHKEGQHFPDTYKTPFHESFSNESKYALPSAPMWRQNSNGRDELYHPGTNQILLEE